MSISSSSAKVIADSRGCDSFELSSCSFTSCKTISGSFVDLTCQQFEMQSNEFTSDAQPNAALPYISMASGSSVVRDTVFIVSGNSPSSRLIELTCPAGAVVEFYNCCFTHTGDISSAGPVNLQANVEGKVTLSTVCFDMDEAKSVGLTG